MGHQQRRELHQNQISPINEVLICFFSVRFQRATVLSQCNTVGLALSQMGR